MHAFGSQPVPSIKDSAHINNGTEHEDTSKFQTLYPHIKQIEQWHWITKEGLSKNFKDSFGNRVKI